MYRAKDLKFIGPFTSSNAIMVLIIYIFQYCKYPNINEI